MPKIEDRKLTQKENFLRVLTGKEPEWVPIYTMGMLPPGSDEPSEIFMAIPIVIDNHHKHNDGSGALDPWGVNYIGTKSTNMALMPDTRHLILNDITKWRDIIKAPDIFDLDFEAMIKEELKDVDRTNTAVGQKLHFGYFQNLMAFMGMADGMCALYEEPEEVKALLDYMCTFYVKVAEKTIDIYKPDVWVNFDDTAALKSPFISYEMWEEFFLPCYIRQFQPAIDRGIPIMFHNCGKSQQFMDRLHDFGVTAWDPAQTCNDLDAFKAKWGRDYVIIGGWDARDRLLEPDVTDEEIIESVKAAYDRLAPGGGYMFIGGFMGAQGDTTVAHKNAVVASVTKGYGYTFYDKD